MTGSIGLLVNPASGKDIRRLVAKASVFDNQEKRAIVRRAITGAIAAGVSKFFYVDDSNRITASAISEAEAEEMIEVEAVPSANTRSVLDTIIGVQGLQQAACNVVISLGGDGTNRALVKGWRHAPLIPISTGTNNAFPVLVEATIAGAAAGLIASAQVELCDVSMQAKIICIEIEDEEDDVALVDAVLTDDRFVGARALLDSSKIKLAMLTFAQAASVGIASIGGLIHSVSRADQHGLLLKFSQTGRRINAPIAPGLYQPIGVDSATEVPCEESMTVIGPGVLALDGERERVLNPGQKAVMTIRRDGPLVVDVHKTLATGASNAAFWMEPDRQLAAKRAKQ